MKTLLKYLPLISLALLIGCSSSQNKKFTAQQLEELDALIEAKSFEFVANWARPLTTSAFNQIATAGLLLPGSTPNNIDLTGNANYFRMVGDSVYAYFPYYGERQMGAVYPGTDNSIHFQGIPDDFSMERNEKGYKFSFTINDRTETYQVNAQWFPSKTGNININSSQRFPIAYSGRIDTFEPKQ
ncbi:DUF4251 domain-containing protein [Flagellimonas allohymeniacidonis]|uniref:DUF4251 domain-containing protein n=1 Tax=Flagellimonas allohymeniacidonis TaxID=2517819 RepID=A0A4Q8QJC8_9FLAO|nr:DUF4251 domain-containing protein [Allomuricauda hymeniacidonis]TAI48843.1 DUF4251 domain-containing protein [Allomuricauda hymeniacidonis]